jgi:hypothetical protein
MPANIPEGSLAIIEFRPTHQAVGYLTGSNGTLVEVHLDPPWDWITDWLKGQLRAGRPLPGHGGTLRSVRGSAEEDVEIVARAIEASAPGQLCVHTIPRAKPPP